MPASDPAPFRRRWLPSSYRSWPGGLSRGASEPEASKVSRAGGGGGVADRDGGGKQTLPERKSAPVFSLLPRKIAGPLLDANQPGSGHPPGSNIEYSRALYYITIGRCLLNLQDIYFDIQYYTDIYKPPIS